MMLRNNKHALRDISNTDAEIRANKRQRKSFEGPAVPAEETLLAVIDNLQKPKRQSSGRKKVETLQPLPAAPEVILIPPEPPKENTVPPTTATEPLSVTTNFIRDKTKDPVHCTELLTEMYGRWKALEIEFSPTQYMADQRDITFRMRGILVDWLIEVHYKFKMHGPSLWLTINILDRYLQKSQISRDKLQLIGVASMLLASKFDEVFPPEVKDCVQITDSSYTRREIIQMESRIFQTLNYQVAVPTGFHFMIYFLNLIEADDITKYLALFYAERNLQEQHFLSVLPSHFTAAAIMAALWKRKSETHNFATQPPITAESVWPKLLIDATGYTGENLLPCARNMILNAGQEPVTTSQRRLIAAKKKYSQDKYSNIAALPLPII